MINFLRQYSVWNIRHPEFNFSEGVLWAGSHEEALIKYYSRFYLQASQRSRNKFGMTFALFGEEI